MFRKFLLGIVLVFFFTCLSFQTVFAQYGNSKPELLKARVIKIIEEGEVDFDPSITNQKQYYQVLEIKILSGVKKNQSIILNHGKTFSVRDYQKVSPEDIIIISPTDSITQEDEYYIVDKYRLGLVYGVATFFVLLVLLFSRLKGVGAIAGMFVSIFVIVRFIIPQILDGKDPLFVSISGSIIILMTSIYLAHGFSRTTTVAVVATSITLVLTGVLSIIFVNLANLSGLGSEDAASLQIGMGQDINFRGLLLGGMIIGFLGVLDDITTALSATVFELKKVNPKLSFSQLIRSSMAIGQEHISSLVNTLVLAYAGTSLPLFLFIVLNPQSYPLWFILNSELISEEIIRTLVGSIGLLLAVPITTVIAAKVASKI